VFYGLISTRVALKGLSLIEYETRVIHSEIISELKKIHGKFKLFGLQYNKF